MSQPDSDSTVVLELDDIQYGAVHQRPSPYVATYLLVRVDDRWAGRELLRRLRPLVDAAGPSLGGSLDTSITVAFTYMGLRALGVPEALPGLIEELSRENVSVIVSPGPAIRAVREKIKSIPVVFAFSGDPVAAGFVDTLSHGKENLTGLSYVAVELNGKRLELMKEILPAASRVTLLTNPIHPGEHLEVAESQRVAAALGMSLQYLQVRTPAEFDAAFRAMSDSKTEGIVAVPDNLIMLERARLTEFARDRRIPVISGWGEFAESGGLLTYGPNSRKFFRRLAGYVQKILAGGKPGEIPIEQPTTFELVINRKVARELRLDNRWKLWIVPT